MKTNESEELFLSRLRSKCETIQASLFPATATAAASTSQVKVCMLIVLRF